jgi:hypothetical protein
MPNLHNIARDINRTIMLFNSGSWAKENGIRLMSASSLNIALGNTRAASRTKQGDCD